MYQELKNLSIPVLLMWGAKDSGVSLDRSLLLLEALLGAELHIFDGAAHWVQFHLSETGRRLLADFAVPARFAFDNGLYRHHSAALNDDLRQSLVEDLQLSDRD